MPGQSEGWEETRLLVAQIELEDAISQIVELRRALCSCKNEHSKRCADIKSTLEAGMEKANRLRALLKETAEALLRNLPAIRMTANLDDVEAAEVALEKNHAAGVLKEE